MPLIKSSSKTALKKNIEAEMKAHPDQKQRNLAIAYAVQRKNAKLKKMADGGPVDPNASDDSSDPYKQAGNTINKATQDNDKYDQFKKNNPFAKKMAQGGIIEHDDDLMDELHEADRDFTETNAEEHMHDVPEHMIDEHHDVELEEEEKHQPSDAEIIHRILRKHKKM